MRCHPPVHAWGSDRNHLSVHIFGLTLAFVLNRYVKHFIEYLNTKKTKENGKILTMIFSKISKNICGVSYSFQVYIKHLKRK